MKETITQEISKPQMAILTSTASVNLFLGGVGSGKTFLGGVISRRFISQFPECRGFIAANTYDQLNTSTLFRIREYWASTGITEWNAENPKGVYVSGKEPPGAWLRCKRNFDRFTNIISFSNGALIFVGSLDNAVMHSGKEFAWAILDETKDSKEEDVKEIIVTRLRQKGMYLHNGILSKQGTDSEQHNPLYILTSPAKVDWINEWFNLEAHIDDITSSIYSKKDYFWMHDGDKFVTISSTYHNAINVGENFIKNVLSQNTEERGKALIYANPFTLTGGEFYSSFDRLTHVTNEVKYDQRLSLHISFDQNSVPYNSASIWQVTRDKQGIYELKAIDEIALINPRNSTEEVCEEFILRYPNHSAGVYFYGDASGRARSTMSKEFKHHYEIIEYKLYKYLVNGSNRVLLNNPAVAKRRDFVNKIFEEKLPIRIKISEDCHYLISDLMYCKQAADGAKDKSIYTDKDTGEKYQKYGHLGDTFEYLIVELFKDFYYG